MKSRTQKQFVRLVLLAIVTAQPHLNHNPTPTQQKVGWDTVITKKPPHPTHHKLKLHERTRIEQYLENKIY